MDGSAKPTPESIPDPTPEVLLRIQSRKDKEANLAREQPGDDTGRANVEANGWTSRMRTYF
jgi:hypothetical protein